MNVHMQQLQSILRDSRQGLTDPGPRILQRVSILDLRLCSGLKYGVKPGATCLLYVRSRVHAPHFTMLCVSEFYR